jgi:sugar lactone lactonase YvrE
VSEGGAVEDWIEIIPEGTRSRLNDGGCDPAGRFLVGSLPLDGRSGEEVLVRVDGHGAVDVIDNDLGLSNGLGFTPSGDTLYSTDTRPGVIWVRPYDASTGTVGPRREFLRIERGKPDGLCVDRDGNLWIAIWGAGEVRCHAADGALIAVVAVAAPNTSSVAFVGAELDTLLITTASEQLTESQLAEYPDSGRLFTVDVGGRGLPVPLWAGRA